MNMVCAKGALNPCLVVGISELCGPESGCHVK